MMRNDRAEHFKRLRGVYRSAFCNEKTDTISPAGKEVLANLKQLSGYGQSPYRSDPVAMAYAVGQQDVVRHIFMLLNMPDEEIYRLTATVNISEGSYFND